MIHQLQEPVCFSFSFFVPSPFSSISHSSFFLFPLIFPEGQPETEVSFPSLPSLFPFLSHPPLPTETFILDRKCFFLFPCFLLSFLLLPPSFSFSPFFLLFLTPPLATDQNNTNFSIKFPLHWSVLFASPPPPLPLPSLSPQYSRDQ